MKDEYVSSGRHVQKQKTRRRILNSAQTLIEKGIDFSLEDVAETAQISRATVYRYFSSVEGLASEAGLDINTLSPEEVLEMSLADELSDTLLNIQDYYNQLGLDHEAAFRNYLSVMINPRYGKNERGARRPKTLSLALRNKLSGLSQVERDHLINTATVLMGMEALITTKDVCQLNNVQSKATLKWGLTQVLNSVLNNTP